MIKKKFPFARYVYNHFIKANKGNLTDKVELKWKHVRYV